MRDFNPFCLKGKRILVTGASSGIGRQIALSCAQMGANLVLVGRDEVRLNNTFSTLKGDNHSFVQADLQDFESFAKIAVKAGELNGLVHAAGALKLAPFRMINKKHLDDIFSINTFAPLLLTKSLLAKKQILNGGSIVFIGAVASDIGPVATTAYSGSKAALLGAVRSLALEVVKQKIRANIISPGYVRTAMLDSLINSGGELDNLVALAPLGIGEPEDIANAAIFYLSNASQWITRSEFFVDGGLTISMNI